MTIILLLLTLMAPVPQKQRIIPCRVTQIQPVDPPEAQLVISDMVLIHVQCKGVRLEIPAHEWPEVWGDPVEGKRVLMVLRDGKRYPVRGR